MPTISEKLLRLNEAKQSIKTAIENKGQDLTGVPFSQYADKIKAISSGKRVTTGTVTFATAGTRHTITHNLGTIPSVFALFPTNLEDFPQSGTDEAKGMVRGFVSVLMLNDFLCQTCNQGNTNTGSLNWQPVDAKYGGGLSKITETTIETGTFGASYKYQADKEYSWIAIE